MKIHENNKNNLANEIKDSSFEDAFVYAHARGNFKNRKLDKQIALFLGAMASGIVPSNMDNAKETNAHYNQDLCNAINTVLSLKKEKKLTPENLSQDNIIKILNNKIAKNNPMPKFLEKIQKEMSKKKCPPTLKDKYPLDFVQKIQENIPNDYFNDKEVVKSLITKLLDENKAHFGPEETFQAQKAFLLTDASLQSKMELLDKQKNQLQQTGIVFFTAGIINAQPFFVVDLQRSFGQGNEAEQLRPVMQVGKAFATAMPLAFKNEENPTQVEDLDKNLQNIIPLLKEFCPASFVLPTTQKEIAKCFREVYYNSDEKQFNSETFAKAFIEKLAVIAKKHNEVMQEFIKRSAGKTAKGIADKVKKSAENLDDPNFIKKITQQFSELEGLEQVFNVSKNEKPTRPNTLNPRDRQKRINIFKMREPEKKASFFGKELFKKKAPSLSSNDKKQLETSLKDIEQLEEKHQRRYVVGAQSSDTKTAGKRMSEKDKKKHIKKVNEFRSEYDFKKVIDSLLDDYKKGVKAWQQNPGEVTSNDVKNLKIQVKKLKEVVNESIKVRAGWKKPSNKLELLPKKLKEQQQKLFPEDSKISLHSPKTSNSSETSIEKSSPKRSEDSEQKKFTVLVAKTQPAVWNSLAEKLGNYMHKNQDKWKTIELFDTVNNMFTPQKSNGITLEEMNQRAVQRRLAKAIGSQYKTPEKFLHEVKNRMGNDYPRDLDQHLKDNSRSK